MAYPADSSRHDVFLSFRGEDTRDNITDHLYAALVRAALDTFRDNDSIDRGQELKPEIDRAIKASEASVIVFSENFATSTWCLDELSLILEQRSETLGTKQNHFVLPVFYKVDPSDVRNQTKSFSIEVKPDTRWTNDNVIRWKTALTKAANLTGLVLSGSETKFVKDIVDIIYNKLTFKKFHLPLNLVKMDTRYKEIDYWIKQSNVNFLVICGMGGSGKTTLAQYTVYSNQDKFENISIVEHIDSKWKEPHHLLKLQETLLGGLELGVEKQQVLNHNQGKVMIEKALRRKKALIVLDDIANHVQLEDLLGRGSINEESKIIVTTRETSMCKWVGSTYGGCREYEMELLDDNEALELFSFHAFGSKNPIEGYKELAQQVVGYCDGNPLALEVLGSSLSHDLSITHWKSELDKLKKDIHSGIHRVLIRSYTSLPYECEKELFLHIACFFNGVDVDYVVKILEHSCSAVASIKTLTKRCLLSISPNQTLMMHPLLQEMGRLIVSQESPKDPAQRSRVWESTESHDMLRKGTGSYKVEGLALDNQWLREEKHAFQGLELKTNSLKNMNNLKLLCLKSVKLVGSYKHFSKDLLWLCWFGFHLHNIPSDLFMGSLVALDMSYSCLEEFEPPTDIQSLKILNLKDSHKLLKICNINKMPNLETCILWNCHKLVDVCETIGDLKSLALLNMTGCENLWKNSFPFPFSLERLFLKDCKLEHTDSFLLNFSDQSSMRHLSFENNLFEFLPNYNHLGNLNVLDLTKCSKLKELLSLPSTLTELYISYCVSLEKVTFDSHRFTLQKLVYEGCTSLSEIEGFIKLVPVAKFDVSDLGHMKWLKEYEEHEMRLAGGGELTKNKCQCVQVLYEFGIISISLPDIKIPKMMPECATEKTSSVSLKVPECLENRSLKGLNVIFKYTIEDDDWAWFAKISTTSGVNLMYNPTLSGRPALGKVGIWLSYWPIGNKMCEKDEINVSIVVVRGLKVSECGASLVTNEEIADGTFENKMGWVETLDGDLSEFQLSTGGNYLCRRDFFDKMEVEEPTPRWFRILVGRNIDHAEVRGWTRTGRPNQSTVSSGPEPNEICNTKDISKSSLIDTNAERTSSITGEALKSGAPFGDAETKFKSEEEKRVKLHKNVHGLVSTSSAGSYHQNYMKLDVFLSFRGEDTRFSFTDHLYASLKRAGVNTFRDDGEIQRGQDLAPGIVEAIEESMSSIVVLSENYAKSRWCLHELTSILEQRRKGDHFVLPVFYMVNPSDVRNQQHSFSIEGSNWEEENVNKWKSALREVADLSGIVVSGSERALIEKIVDTIVSVLESKHYRLTGIETQAEEINFWLKNEHFNTNVLAICGMAGSGKTTLAQYIYNLNNHNFESSCFLDDIGNRFKETHDLLRLQKQLLRNILGHKIKMISSVAEGTAMISEVLIRKRVLIVLDDIDEHFELGALIGKKDTHTQSKIIVTIRLLDIHSLFESISWRCHIHELKLLNDHESLELFSFNAFGSKVPLEGFRDLAAEVAQYCGGNPAALKILGSSLYFSSGDLVETNSMKEIWRCRMDSLFKGDFDTLRRELEKSFNSLPLVSYKELFLQIAVFSADKDEDYVVNILEQDQTTKDGIMTLINRCLLTVSPNKKLIMHPLNKNMGRHIAREDAKCTGVRSSDEAHNVLITGEGVAIEGEAIDTHKQKAGIKPLAITTDWLAHMHKLKLLQLKYVKLSGSYKNMSQVRWLCLHGCDMKKIPSGLLMSSFLVAIDMTKGNLEKFDPPMLIPSLRILNLKDSQSLRKVCNIFRLPNLETLILSNCHMLVHVCETLGDLTNLTLLDMTECENLFEGDKPGTLLRLVTSNSNQRRSFSLPHSLERLFLKDCNIENTNLFESLPSYSHLINLRVLDVTMYSKLKRLLSLPNTLTELYINYCESLEKVTFESHRFTLQEFGCEGCINLSEVEGIIKLEPVGELEGSYLGHMKWLKEYQDHEVCLIGNNELTIGRSCRVQMLCEFGIMSTSLPDTKDPNMTQHISESSSLYFDVPQCSKSRRLKGLNVTFKYTISSDNSVWFARISTNNGLDLMYNPTVFGKPEFGEVGVWFSYWPIGNKLHSGDKITVSIIVMSGLEVIECGASLVYTYEVSNATLESDMGSEETLGGDLSRFKLSTGAYYLCRHDFFKFMEVNSLAPDWFRVLVGDTVDETELQGWKISGRPKQANPSITELY